MRAYSRDRKGHLDESLIPDAFVEWYPDSPSGVSDFEGYVGEDELHTDKEKSFQSSILIK